MARSIKPMLCTLYLLAAVGCGELPAVPSHDGPRWFELETEHFVLYTDQSEAQARTTSVRLERLLDGLLHLGFQVQGTLKLKMNVFVLDDRAEFERLVGADYDGRFIPTLLFEPVVMLSRQTDAESLRPLTHELAHFIIDQSSGSPPLWLTEGLATYFESARFTGDGAFVIGEVPRQHIRWLHKQQRMPAAQLLHLDGGSDSSSMYASAWLLVHYLMSERGTQFAAFQTELARGTSPDESWALAFPDLTPSHLDKLLDRYAMIGEYPKYTQLMAATPVEPKLRELSDADVYALRAELYLGCVPCGDDRSRLARETAEQALKLDPANERAGALALVLAAPDPVAARRFVDQHRTSWLAWLLLARAEVVAANRCSTEIANQLVSLAPARPHAVMMAAECELAAGHRDQAIALSARALRRAPNDAGLLVMRAVVLQSVGRCGELAQLLARARNSAHSASTLEQLQRFGECDAPATP